MPTKEKRQEVRKRTGDIDNATIKMPLPFPKGVFLEKELVDFSEHGASFSMTNEEGHLLPKTPLNNITITYDDNVTRIKNAEVVYAAQLNSGSDWIKIGIHFNHNGHIEQDIFPVRPERYGENFFGNLDRFVSFKDESGTEYLCNILNVSRHGLAFSIQKDSIIFKVSSVINNFRVIINNEVTFDGDIVVSRITENNDNFIIGGEFRERLLDIEDVTIIKKKAEVKTDIINYVEDSVLLFERIDEHFKQKVADIGYILSKAKDFLDEEENSISDLSSSDREEVACLILDDIASSTYPKINSLLEELDTIGSKLEDDRMQEIYKEYFQSHLHPYFLLAPVLYRILKKPLGYAGDYEMMNMLYANDYDGPTLFAKYVNKFACQVRPAQTSRNRVGYLTEKIQRVADEVIGKKGRKAKIMTIGCGPAIEFQRFVELDDNSNNTEVTLVDFEKEALSHAKDKIMDLKVKHKRDLEIHPRFSSILQMIKDYKRGKKVFEKQDLIYCSGLFEYLSPSTCKLLIKFLYQTLNKTGQIIVGNFDEINNYRYFMDYCGEWYLIYRNEKSMLDLASEVKDAKSIYVEKEETKLNDFLVIEK